GDHVGVGEGGVAVGSLHDDEAGAGRDTDIAAGGQAVAGGEAVGGGDARDVGAVPVEVDLGDRRGGRRAAGVGGEGSVDVGLEPDGAAVVVGQLGVQGAAVVHVVEDRDDSRGAVGAAQIGVAEVDAGIDDGDERPGAVEAGGSARGGGVDGGARGVEQWTQD